MTQILSAHGVEYRVHEHEPVITLQDVTSHLGFEKGRLVKTLAFRAAQSLILVALRGSDRVDYAKLAGLLGVGRGDIDRATPEDVQQTVGAQVGGIAPVSAVAGVRMIFDTRVAAIDRIYCGIGDNDKTLEVNTHELIAHFGPLVAPIAAEEGA